MLSKDDYICNRISWKTQLPRDVDNNISTTVRISVLKFN